MNSRFYPIYQTIGWLIAYGLIVAGIYTRPGASELEFIFAAVLIGTAASYSHGMRWLFKRWVHRTGVALQLMYFIAQSIIGAVLAALALIAVVWAFAEWGVIDPIAPGQFGFVFQQVFYANAFNMLVFLLLWSAFYVTLNKARQLRDASQALASSQLQTLSQQLNPHFLFNMLNNIRALILEDQARARDSLARLADMLRYSLQQHEQSKVAVADELEMVHEYIELCKIQFEDRLQFHTDVSEAARSMLLPRMLLQLCVENAVKHGVAQRPQPTRIELRINVENARLLIEMLNDCPTESAKLAESSGIGLKNINKRIEIMYARHPVRPRLDFSRQGERAHTMVELPAEDNEAHENSAS